VERIAHELHRDVRGVTDEAMQVLSAYPWPGNVRELENALTRAAVLARGPVIGAEHLLLGAVGPPGTAHEAEPPADESMAAIVHAHALHVLSRTGGNKRQAARVLGISRSRLDRILAGDRTAPERD